ncbi:MAG: MOSC N-terminal beta barrel domain-containing protein, partial [Saprospiraceae bacterium]
MALILSKILIYPIKSCGGISLSSSKAESRGLQYDRRWMLIDVIGRCITQRESSAMALMRIELHKDCLVVYHTDEVDDQILVPFLNAEELSNSPRLEVTLWDDICEAIVYPDFINKWFSNKINMDCRLVYMPDDSIRKVDPRYAADGEITSFSDGYPILLLGQASLDDLNQRMADPIPINRFRP